MNNRIKLNQRHKLSIDKLNLINFFAKKERENVISNSLSLFGGRKSPCFDKLIYTNIRPTIEIKVTLFANTDNRALQSESLQLSDPSLGLFDNSIVETTTETSVAGDDHKGNLLYGSNICQRHIYVFGLKPLIDVVEDLDESLRKGSAIDDRFLGSADLGGRDKLHGFGYLLGILYGIDSLS
ncbi:hypothetical protein TorRG33x02_123030 [Trema orientale]|uniref:Uncharacterized protein n=1 Tax=Trema orientale TaxID=63057 RepID=A0A2P5F2H2_TREOI|nr:hypothetical protein TorRG33x02_123030 [Trema orientale]